MNRIFIIALVAVFAALTDPSRGASGTFSGRIWNDINRDGIQDVDEPPMANLAIGVFNDVVVWLCGCPGYVCPISSHYTDSNGYYNFSVSITNEYCPDVSPGWTTEGFFVTFVPVCNAYGLSPINVGTNDAIDSDYSYCSMLTTGENVDLTIVDIGMFRWNNGVSLDVTVTNAPNGSPYYVTTGTEVTYSYRVVNTGETYISQMQVTDDTWIEFLGDYNCPASLDPGESYTFTVQRVMSASITNIGTVVAVPVDPGTCNALYSYDPVWDESQAIVIVVTNLLNHIDGDIFPNWWEMQYGFDPLNSNAPNVNSDSDWMSNYEEFIAGTNPTNGASYFSNAGLTEDFALMVTPSVTNRVYNIWRSTNLLGEPQEWSLYPPEQTGTGSAVLFPIPDDDPAAHYRTGVRLP